LRNKSNKIKYLCVYERFSESGTSSAIQGLTEELCGVRKGSDFMLKSHSLFCFAVVGLSLVVSSNAVGSQNQSWGHQSQFGVEAEKAWALVKDKCQNSGVIVAVIDTGIDPNHPDLKNSLWKNTKEIAGKAGQDSDKNGFIDDKHGWDFVTQSGRLVDTHGHGTHIAGIIGAKAASPTGYNGVCPGVQIMSLRYYNERASGVENLRNTIRAIEYAVANGAHIINYSGGGAEFSHPEMQALKKAEAKGVLVVAAAGNERSNADIKHYYPAAYDLANMLSITAINQTGQVLPSSNWGVQKVQLAAPGNSILSTLPGSAYGFMTGTSQATAFVSGIAALMLSTNRNLTVADLKSKITQSAKKYPQLVGKTQFGATANALAAVELAMKAGSEPTPKATPTPAARSFAAENEKAQQVVAPPLTKLAPTQVVPRAAARTRGNTRPRSLLLDK
jgi:thermitase